MSRLIRMDQSGHTTPAEWTAEDPAKAQAALAAFRAELRTASSPSRSRRERWSRSPELPVHAPLVILRRPIAGG